MHILTHVSTFAAFVLFLFPVPCLAQIEVPLAVPLPLEVRSPYLNFWTRPPSSSGNTTTSANLFFAEAVRHLNPPSSDDPLTFESTPLHSFPGVPLYFGLTVLRIRSLDNPLLPIIRISPGPSLLLLAPFSPWI
jgi:hypothetical protein